VRLLVRLRDAAMIVYYGSGKEVSGMTIMTAGAGIFPNKKRRPSQLGILQT